MVISPNPNLIRKRSKITSSTYSFTVMSLKIYISQMKFWH